MPFYDRGQLLAQYGRVNRDMARADARHAEAAVDWTQQARWGALAPGWVGVVAVYDRSKADIVDASLVSAVKKSRRACRRPRRQGSQGRA